MTYMLKDHELQRKLDDLSGGDFTKKLQDEAKWMFSTERAIALVLFGPKAKMRIMLDRDEITFMRDPMGRGSARRPR